MNVTLKASTKFSSSVRTEHNNSLLSLYSDTNTDMPFGTPVFYMSQEYRLGAPSYNYTNSEQMRAVKAVPLQLRTVSFPAGTEYTLPIESDPFGLVKVFERTQTFILQSGTTVKLPVGSQLHNETSFIELREENNVVLL